MSRNLAFETVLLGLWNSRAMDECYGESISVRDHLLQSAELASAQGLPPVLVAAALLHDIGWAMADAAPHETAAADWLEPLFGPGVAGPVRWHVAAKRYLVATDRSYFAKLSAESVRTLVQQGGPMTDGECAAFEDNSHFRHAITLRLIDDAAKSLDKPATSIGDYLDTLAEIAVP